MECEENQGVNFADDSYGMIHVEKGQWAGFTGRLQKINEDVVWAIQQLLESTVDLHCCDAINSDSAMSLAYNQAHFVCETWDDDLPHSL